MKGVSQQDSLQMKWWGPEPEAEIGNNLQNCDFEVWLSAL